MKLPKPIKAFALLRKGKHMKGNYINLNEINASREGARTGWRKSSDRNIIKIVQVEITVKEE